ncbi:hypothetical protein GP486_007983, partial [Trichoglossum hirsutum]
FSSLVEAKGGALLDLLLFISSKNYESVTRPLYSAILPWPVQYFSVPKLRSAAKARIEHLGFSALDVDDAADDSEENAQTSAAAAASASLIPPSLRRPKETVVTVLTQPVHASQFRLDALTVSVLDPLQELLGQKRFFLSDTQASSLDCLVLGYLALFLYPDLPHSWLADTMRRKYAKLCDYVNDLRGRFFGRPITTSSFREGEANQETNKRGQEDAIGAAHYTVLPWATAENRGISQTGSLLLENVMDMPPLNYIPKASQTGGITNSTRAKNPGSSTNATAPHLGLSSQAFAITAGVSAVVGYLLYTATSPGEEQEKTSSLRDMGEAGAILSGISNYSTTEQNHPHHREEGNPP